jgi:deoxyribodipyrimidine photo-lyase
MVCANPSLERTRYFVTHTAIWWIRRDLRIRDNQALNAALDANQQIIPVFILDPRLLQSSYSCPHRLAFLFNGLRSLQAGLERYNGRLILEEGEPPVILSRLMAASGASRIYAEPDYSPFATRRDRQVADELPVEWVGSPALHPPGSVVKASGEPYVVFTPFSKAWRALPAPAAPAKILPGNLYTPDGINSLPIPEKPTLPESVPFEAGEEQAERRLNAFVQGPGSPIFDYSEGRDWLGEDGTSRLSPYLRFGMISARRVFSAARQAILSAEHPAARKGAETWLNELIWRDFYIHILHHFPQVRQQNFRMQSIPWENDPQKFDAWKKGETGYPVVDAAMRQLLQTGWMHNRARMITASFLTKDLLIDWRWGERWFMQQLLDGDPAANNGGWQWTAGTGTDAAPYFRIFNPISQGRRHDPTGRFIRRWLPELAKLPDEFIHEPWKMPDDLQHQTNCRIGKDYPEPIVDHAKARERALSAYGQAR